MSISWQKIIVVIVIAPTVPVVVCGVDVGAGGTYVLPATGEPVDVSIDPIYLLY